MRTLTYLLVLLTLVSCAGTSQRMIYLADTAPPAEYPLDLALYEEKYQHYDGVTLEREKTFEYNSRISGQRIAGAALGTALGVAAAATTGVGFIPTGSPLEMSYSHVHKHRYLILNPHAEALSTFSMEVPVGSVALNFYLNVISPGGETSRYGFTDLFKQETADPLIEFQFAIPQVEKGTIVEYAYEWEYGYIPAAKQLLPSPFHMSNYSPLPCEQLTVNVGFPQNWGLQVKNLTDESYPYHLVNTHKDHGKKMLVYTAENLPAYIEEPFAPIFWEHNEYVEFVFRNRLKYQADYWHEVATNFRYGLEIYSPRLYKAERELLNLIDRIAPECEEGADFLCAVMDYLYTEVEIVSGSSRNMLPINVVRRGKGSILELCHLIHALLHIKDIESRILLVHPAEEGYFDPYYQTVTQFRLTAVSAKIDGKDYVVFPGLPDLTTGSIPAGCLGESALIINKPDCGVMTDLPDTNFLANEIHWEHAIEIGRDGILSVVETRTFHGSSGALVRERFRDLSPEETDTAVQADNEQYACDLKLKSYEIANLDSRALPPVLKQEYTIDNLVSILPDEVIFQTGGFLAELTRESFGVEPGYRHNPIRLYESRSRRHSIHITYPEDWILTSALDNLKLENRFGSISLTFRRGGGFLDVELHKQLHRIEASREEIPAVPRDRRRKQSIRTARSGFHDQPGRTLRMITI